MTGSTKARSCQTPKLRRSSAAETFAEPSGAAIGDEGIRDIYAGLELGNSRMGGGRAAPQPSESGADVDHQARGWGLGVARHVVDRLGELQLDDAFSRHRDP